MKKIHLLVLFAALCMVFSSCEEEPIDGPVVTLLSEQGFASTETILLTSSSFSVKLDAIKGANPLKTLFIKEDGILVDTSRMTINGAPAKENPIVLSGGETDGFNFEITIDAQNSCDDVQVYIFDVHDTEMNTHRQNLLITSVWSPSLVIDGATEFVIVPNDTLKLDLITELGALKLNSISVSVEDINGDFNLVQDLNTLFFEDINTTFSTNPYMLGADDQLGFTKSLFIIPDLVGLSNYRIEVQDIEGCTFSQDILVSLGTEISSFYLSTLSNDEKSDDVGGLDLDLDKGSQVGSSNPTADIRDAGINVALPEADNWIQRIAGVDGTSIRKINDVLPSGTSFADIEFVETIDTLYDAAIDFNYNIGGINYSDVVAVGDIFAVKGDSANYLMLIREVNLTPTDNSDNYALSVRF